jgi:hypothetical protein
LTAWSISIIMTMQIKKTISTKLLATHVAQGAANNGGKHEEKADIALSVHR